MNGQLGNQIAMIPRMATAIIRRWTPEGFVIAADGRVTALVTRKVLRDDKQKIFQIGESLCFSIAGVTETCADDSDDSPVAFDLNEVVIQETQAIPPKQFADLECYASLVAERCVRNLRAAHKARAVQLPYKGLANGFMEPTLATMFVDGLLGGKAQSVEVRFARSQDGPIDPVTRVCNTFNNVEATGSAKIFHDLLPDSGAGIRSMDEMKLVASRYIETCIHEGMERDPESCWGIGGMFHMATITRNGFDWVVKPPYLA